jgi:hypothetical protein
VNYSGGTVVVNAPGPGQVLVLANAQMVLFHTAGAADTIQIGIGNSPSDCGTAYDDITWSTPAAMPSFPGTYKTFAVSRAFAVSAAGTYTFYLNGWKTAGGVAPQFQDNFNWGSLHAMYFRQ